MINKQLFENIKKKESFLCIGLDSDIEQLPEGIKKTPAGIFDFNKEIIKNTHKYCVSYKINTAFYESHGSDGWKTLEKTANFIKEIDSKIFLIADAKRCDIENTSKQYAKAFFENMPFDAITLSPYMGKDSIEPFLEYKNKTIIILALTSNKGSRDFQELKLESGEYLFEKIIKETYQWFSNENLMYVVGATKTSFFQKIREIIPNNFLLIPGIGAQGGNLYEIFSIAHNSHCGLLVNSSRSIIFSSKKTDFIEAVQKSAEKLRSEMKNLLHNYNIL